MKKKKMFLQALAYENTINSPASISLEPLLPGIGGALTGAMMVIAIVVLIAVWIYTSFAWMTIARKLKQKDPGLMWVPLVRTARRLQLGNFHWAFIFLLLVPILGWLAVFVLSIIANWRIFEKRKYPGALSLISIGRVIPFINSLAFIGELVVIGLVAWRDNK